MVEPRRVRPRLDQDEEAEAPGGGGGGHAGAEAAAARGVVALLGPARGTPAATASSSVPTPSPKPSSPFLSSSTSTVTAVAAMARSRNDDVQGGGGHGRQAGPDVAFVGTPNGVATAASAAIISPRSHAFSPETWWMVDLEADPPQGATRLVKTCMHAYEWDSGKARSVLRAYRQFLFLKMQYGDYDAKVLSPSSTVDMMWHQHILDVVNYIHDCALLCGGRVVGRDPRGSEQGPERDERRRETRQALLRHRSEIGIEIEEWKELFEDNETGSPATATATATATAAAAAAAAVAPRAAVPAPAPRAAAATATRMGAIQVWGSGSFRLFVITSCGSSVAIDVSPKYGTLSELYDGVASTTGVPSRLFRLTFAGRQLDRNTTSPRSFGLTNNSTIYQVLTIGAANQSGQPVNPERAIQVRMQTQIGSTFTINVWPDSGRLSDVYDAVHAKMGVPSRVVRLTFGGQQMDRGHHTTPRALGLTDESTIYVMIVTATSSCAHSPGNPGRTFQLYFKHLTGKRFSVHGLCPDSGRLSDLFDAVCAEDGVSSERFRLIFAGKQLKYNEHTSLRSVGLMNKSTVHVVSRLRGC